MPGYLFQIASTATAGGRADGLRLRPAVRSRSPIAEYDQRLGLTDWDAAAGASLAGASGQGAMDDGTVTGEAGDPGVLGRPRSLLPPERLRTSPTELAHPVPADDRPADTSTFPAKAATSRETHSYRQPSSEPAEPEPAAVVLDQPKPPVPGSAAKAGRAVMERQPSATRLDPVEPSLPGPKRPPDMGSADRSRAAIPGALRSTALPTSTERAASDASQEMAAAPAAVTNLSQRTALSEEPAGERVRPPSAASRERAMPAAALRPRTARGLADDVGEMRGAAGPRVIIDRLEIEIVPPPPPPVSARKPGAGEGVGLNRAVSKIGPLNDPLAAGRALSLRYR